MTITTKENANGRISGYYVDGVKVRKNEIDSIINARRDEIIYVDYYTGQEFKMLTRSFNRQLKVVFTGYSETIMTQAAADELGYNVIRNWTGTTYSNACLVEKKNDAETDGSEDDADDNNDVFNYLPAIENLNDVDTTQSVDEMKAAADQMGLMQLNRKIADLEEQLIDNRLAATAVLNEITDDTTFAEQKEIERRYSKYAAISDALIDEKAIYKAAKSTRLSQITAIKNLMSKNGTTTIAQVKTDDTKNKDNFNAEFAKLKAERDTAKKIVEEKERELFQAQRAADNADNALYKFGKAKATALENKLLPRLGFSKICPIVTQDGDIVDKLNFRPIAIEFHHAKFNFQIKWSFTTFGEYDTPAQIETVIHMLKAAIARGDEEFTFPTVDELNTPSEMPPCAPKSPDITAVEEIAADETVEPETTENAVKEICERVRNVRKRGINHVVTSKGRHMWYEHGSLTSKDIIAIILAKEGFTIEEYIAAEETAEDYWWNVELPRMVAISNQATFLEDKHWREVKSYDEEFTANVMPPEVDDSEDELVDPPDKADIYDSLARAMEIALLKYQDFCREYNLKAAQNELSLFNICSNAMRELSEAVA